MPRSFAIKDINDYQREEEEFNMRKAKQAQSMAISKAAHDDAMIASKFKRDNPGGGVDAPSSVREAKHLEGLLKNKEYEKANRFMALKRSQAYGIDSFGSPVMQVPDESAPEFIPEGQPIDAQPEIPEYSTPFNPGPSISEQLARNAGLKSGAEEQGKQDVLAKMAPSLEGEKAAAKFEQELKFKPQISQADIAAKDKATKEIELAERESMIPELEITLDELDAIANEATYTLAGQAYDVGRTQLGMDASPGAIARTEYDTTISNIILPLLRQTFGAAFTAKEGDSLRATLGNINATPEQKQAAIRSFISQRKRNIISRRRELGKDIVGQEAPADPYQADEAAFKLRKQGFTDEQISEYLSAKGGQ